MTNQTVELETLFKKMLEEIDGLIETDEILKKDWEEGDFKIQWFMNGISGYQIFDNGKYTHKFGEEIDNADLTLEFPNIDIALELLSGELKEYSHVYYKRKFRLYSVDHMEEVERKTGPVIIKHLKLLLTAKFTRGITYHPTVLTKLPVFRKIVVKLYQPENNEGSYIPINTSLGTYENKLLPEKLIEYFINKTDHIYVLNACGCRLYHNCQDHEKFIGCMFLGKDTTNLKLGPERGRYITREEALNHVKKSIENGLVPVFGRAPIESVGLAVEDTGHFMSMCFCCPCCCINGKIAQSATSALYNAFSRMEGLTVEVNSENCIGCGACYEVCIFVGRNEVDGKAVIDQERCLGCGRCERVCQNDAITITIDDPKRLDEHIQRLEEKVDVT